MPTPTSALISTLNNSQKAAIPDIKADELKKTVEKKKHL